MRLSLFKMRKILPAYLLVPLFAGLPNLWIIIAKYIFEPNAKVVYLTFGNFVLLFFRQICQYAFIACIHYWISNIFVVRKKFHKLRIFINLFFYGIYFQLFGFSLYDFEFSRNNLQISTPSLYYAYTGNILLDQTQQFSEPIHRIPNMGTLSSANTVVIDSIKDAPGFWIATAIFISIWIVAQVLFLILFSESLILTVRPPIEIINENDFNFLNTSQSSRKIGRIILVVCHFLAIIHFIFAIDLYFVHEDFKMARYVNIPYLNSLLLSLFHFEKKLSKETKRELVNLTRTYLPPGRKWLDNRKDPVYPEVHADMETYCAYNTDDKDCQTFVKTPKQKLVKNMPNIVLLIYESLTPSYYQIDPLFLKEHTHISYNDPKRILTNTPYYSYTTAPNLNKYSKYAITFSGMSALGLPTTSGWHALLTGLSPSQSFTNNVEGGKIHSDDFPSNVRHQGYRSFYISASLFPFDGSNNLVDKKPAEEEAKNILKCQDGFGDMYNETSMQQMFPFGKYPMLRKCTDKEINKLVKSLKQRNLDLPKPFDYSFSYLPAEHNAKYLNIDPKTINKGSSWPADRITAAQVIYHWKQQKDFMKSHNIKQPLFGAHLSIEGHIPYPIRDTDQFYEDPSNYDYLFNGKTKLELQRFRRYIKVTKYADKYQIGRILDWLKENDSNTIFIVAGDHGTRDIPIHDKATGIIDDVVYSGECVHQTSASDSFFVTSGMIGYLGNDPVIKSKMMLHKYAGRTLKVPTDHTDLLYTIEELISELNGTSMPPTHRRSRNLIKLTDQINNVLENTNSNEEVYNMIDKTNWKTFSSVSYATEYREGSSLLRTHPSHPNGAQYYKNTSYPLCMRRTDQKDLPLGTPQAKEMYKRMKKYIQAETFLNYHNRIFNYAFRDTACVEKGKCEFPNPDPIKYNYLFLFALLAPPLIVMIVGFIGEKIIFFAAASKVMKRMQTGNEGSVLDDL